MRKLVRIANLLLAVFLLALATASVSQGEEQPALVTDAWVDAASLNSLGEVVWSQYDSSTGSQQFFSSMRGQLTTDVTSRFSPAVNNMGDMVWSEYSNGYPGGYVLYGRIKGEVVTLANSTNWLGQADINDRGEVVWTQSDNSGESQIYSNLRGQLTSGSLRHDMPSINNRGEIVFRQYDSFQPGPPQIYRIAAASTTPVLVATEGLDYGSSAAINDNGEIFWTVRDNANSTTQIVSSVRGPVLPAPVPSGIFSVDVNSCGDVAYIADEGGGRRLYRLGSNAPCVTYPAGNDTQAEATPVALGDIFTGMVNWDTNNVTDWYRFDASAGDTIYVTANYDTRAPNSFMIGLYDAQGNPVGAYQPGFPVSIISKAAYSGSYYVKVEGGGSRNGYAVSLSKYSENCGAGPCRELLATDVWTGSINSLGEVVWGKYNPEIGTQQFYSSTGRQLPEPMGGSNPVVNNLGDLIWSEYSYGYPGGYLLKGTIRGVPVIIANSADYIGEADLNDRGEVVWSAADSNGTRQVYSNLRGQLTSGPQQHGKPSINNAGDVVCLESDPMQPGPGRIVRIAAGSTVPVVVTTDPRNYRAAAINDSGEMVWAVNTFDNGIPAAQIFSSVRGVIVERVSNDIFTLDVNNCGDIIYSAFDGGLTKLYRFGNSGACTTHPLANDTQSQAAPVGLGDIFTGVVDGSASPFDWYRFKAGAGDTIYVTVNYDNSVPNLLGVGLYDGSGNLVAPAQGIPMKVTFPVGATGTYYLKVEAVAGHVGYAVSLSKYSENCGAGPCRELLADDVWSGSINSLGEVVWGKYNQEIGAQQFFSSTRGQFPAPTGSSNPVVNNMGDMIWSEYSYGYPGGYLLKGTIGGVPVTIANSADYMGEEDLNDRGEVVWSANDANGVRQIYSNLRGQLTAGPQQHGKPSINNAGDVVCVESDPMQPGPGRIVRITAGSSVPVAVTTDQQNYRAAAINDSGEMVWAVAIYGNGAPASQIVSSVRGVVVDRVTSDIFTLDVNNCGDIIYSGFDGGMAKLYRFGNSGACATHPVPNDTQSEATPVALGDIFTGVVDSSANTWDWYRFQAASGDTIYVTVNTDSSAPNLLGVGLYDGQGNLVAPAHGTPLQLTFPVGATGSYYLKVAAGGGRVGYAVSLSKYRQNCGAGPCRELLADDVWSGSINSLGEVVWGKYNQELGAQQFFSTTRGQLPAPPGSSNPIVNNMGDMIWNEYSYGYPGGYLLNGTMAGVPVTIANSANYIGEADLNDRGEVVWSAADDNGIRQIYSNLRGQLTVGPQQHSKPSINNVGDIVFLESDPVQPGPGRILRVAAGSAVPVAVTTDPQHYRAVSINDSGEMVWAVASFDNAIAGWHIVSSVRGELLTDRVGNDLFTLDLNNCGDIIYSTIEGGLARLYRFGNSGGCMAVPERSFSLAVAKVGTGNGEITSSPAGIAVTVTDTMGMAAFGAGTPVTLTATPDAGSRFVGWMGVAGGSEPTCTVMLGQAAKAVAIFEVKPVDTEAPTALAVDTISLPFGTSGTAYNRSLSASGGMPGYTWSVASGSLPDGLTLDPSTGAISGVPDTTGSYAFTVRVADSAGASATASFTINVTTCATAPVSLATLPAAGFNDPFTAYLQAQDDDLIMLQHFFFGSGLTLNRNIRVTLRGGYDCGYTGSTDSSVFNGVLRVQDGTVRVDKLVFR
ncbi:putative Ig domain-containing protein [Geomonas paludis]|uniref:Bacterial repeat domain-containing protein n=1 Tax=Geomonas paludis TaxID=2740185 RepID=A0A6V8N1A0_9BACT|nr:putative Ig domain-containing protein [Geomonas paludis]GFO66181.1 hypothetical protein GMPD_41000 [Geomonas paludis]